MILINKFITFDISNKQNKMAKRTLMEQTIKALKFMTSIAFQVQPDRKTIIYALPLWDFMDVVDQTYIIEMEATFEKAGLIINLNPNGFKQINF